MEPRHLVTQVLGVSVMALTGWWAVVESRRDWKLRRIPLLRGPMSARVLLVVLAMVALVPVVAVSIFSQELVPRDSPLWFVATLGWLSISVVLGLIALITRQLRSGAEGWLTVQGDETLLLDVDGTTSTFVLGVGAVRAYFIDGAPQYVQFVLTDGENVAFFRGAVGIRDMKLVTQGRVVPAQGLMIGSSMKPLLGWLRPFMTTD
ncbi:hypothetical protein [Archangium lipolyticum]|uniref:hypothetical protein n=1 Tax=Archangium lipolyticum TaxID=2970465 RepID=UPI00214A4D11|nr:hypothetical protein [Archangium lipolyticum]